MKDFARNFFGLIFLAGADIIAGSIFIALMIANYMACKYSFDYLGYDGLPLAKEAFIGQIIGPFFPESTLSHFYAFTVAIVVACGLFIIYNRLFHIWELLKERRTYLSQNDENSARIIIYHIYDDIALIISILAPLILALLWDFELFRYRSVVGALGIDNPTQAPLSVENWDNQIKNHGHLFAWTLTTVGAWGYLGITGVSCAALEFCFRRTTERFVRLMNSLENFIQPAAAQPTQQEQSSFYGYDTDGQPVYDPAVPVAYDTFQNPVQFCGYDTNGYPVYDAHLPIAYDTEGTPVQGDHFPESRPSDETNATASSDMPHTESRITKARASQRTDKESTQPDTSACNAQREDMSASSVKSTGTAKSTASHTPLFNSDEVFRNVEGKTGRRTDDTPLKDVIGKPGMQIILADAMAAKEGYWVDPDTFEIWDRDYRRSLFPETY